MAKKIKEGIIFILLTIIIIFLLVITLYEYTPNQKSLSSVDLYKRTEETSNVLKDISSASLIGTEKESVITSYTVSSSDLSSYAKTKTYNQGRSNPFATVTDESSSTTTNSNTEKKSNTTTTSGNSSVSTGYFKSTGTNK